ncbi:tetratricopeptide repeat protein [uncultured Azohydromonas sp.]|jgi:Flp pilus assembly protein TadD, contains TPR repeats|uniref:tetratricopeptide repeat protein n=1 Tax=uncultured Azohydromonas sp. TaxID=487342 RepID=UPI00261DE692|nr:tetratricopeptide repeat protein [uncultured Azohydromonas sp.]
MAGLVLRWFPRPQRAQLRRAAVTAALCTAFAAQAQAPLAPEVPQNSALDAPLLYQLLYGELSLRNGQAGDAYQIILDAARRTREESLFRRAVEIALQGRAGDQALQAARAWRQALPQSGDALRFELQLLLALHRGNEVAEPLRTLLERSPEAERPGLIAALPRLLQRQDEPRQTAQLLETLLKPYLAKPETRTASRVALGSAWLLADNGPRALELAQQAANDDPNSAAPALLALDLLPRQVVADALVRRYLEQPQAEPGVRLAYARTLGTMQRYGEAVQQVELVTQSKPELAPPWLMLGALRLELRESARAEAALQRYLELVRDKGANASEEGEEEAPDEARQRGVTQAQLLLAQAAEQRGDVAQAERWLSGIDDPQRLVEVQSRRALLLAHQGRIEEGRALLHALPERSEEEARTKLLAEVQWLRELKRWDETYMLLARANQRFSADPDLLYEQAMAAEKLDRMDEMERLLRQVIALKPDHQHAYNALGYSLAERNLRLPEARELISKALEMAPGDPFIIDSLGWVEFRLGRREEALQLLQQAYAARPDIEIAAHLGEVLWTLGRRDEALRVWREARGRDGSNELLRATLARLKVDL